MAVHLRLASLPLPGGSGEAGTVGGNARAARAAGQAGGRRPRAPRPAAPSQPGSSWFSPVPGCHIPSGHVAPGTHTRGGSSLPSHLGPGPQQDPRWRWRWRWHPALTAPKGPLAGTCSCPTPRGLSPLGGGRGFWGASVVQQAPLWFGVCFCGCGDLLRAPGRGDRDSGGGPGIRAGVALTLIALCAGFAGFIVCSLIVETRWTRETLGVLASTAAALHPITCSGRQTGLSTAQHSRPQSWRPTVLGLVAGYPFHQPESTSVLGPHLHVPLSPTPVPIRLPPPCPRSPCPHRHPSPTLARPLTWWAVMTALAVFGVGILHTGEPGCSAQHKPQE